MSRTAANPVAAKPTAASANGLRWSFGAPFSGLDRDDDRAACAELEAQDATYGEVLDPAARHPRMWAQKPYDDSARRSFYRFPYTFGFLFGRGVFTRYQVEPESFAGRYRALLSRTGMASAAGLGREFGIDVADVAFWEGALGVTADRVDAYEGLVAAARR